MRTSTNSSCTMHSESSGYGCVSNAAVRKTSGMWEIFYELFDLNHSNVIEFNFCVLYSLLKAFILLVTVHIWKETILCNASSMSLPQRIELVQQEDSAAVCEKTQLLAHVLTLGGAHKRRRFNWQKHFKWQRRVTLKSCHRELADNFSWARRQIVVRVPFS